MKRIFFAVFFIYLVIHPLVGYGIDEGMNEKQKIAIMGTSSQINVPSDMLSKIDSITQRRWIELQRFSIIGLQNKTTVNPEQFIQELQQSQIDRAAQETEGRFGGVSFSGNELSLIMNSFMVIFPEVVQFQAHENLTDFTAEITLHIKIRNLEKGEWEQPIVINAEGSSMDSMESAIDDMLFSEEEERNMEAENYEDILVHAIRNHPFFRISVQITGRNEEGDLIISAGRNMDLYAGLEFEAFDSYNDRIGYLRIEKAAEDHSVVYLLWGEPEEDQIWLERYMYQIHISIGAGVGTAVRNDRFRALQVDLVHHIMSENNLGPIATRPDPLEAKSTTGAIYFSMWWEILDTYGWVIKFDFSSLTDFSVLNTYTFEFGAGYNFYWGRLGIFPNLALGLGLIAGRNVFESIDINGPLPDLQENTAYLFMLGMTFIATPQICFNVRIHPNISINVNLGFRLSPNIDRYTARLKINDIKYQSINIKPEEIPLLDETANPTGNNHTNDHGISFMGAMANLSLDIKF
jgi:hypothetical protein